MTEICSLTVSLGGKPVLNDISARFPAGAVSCIVGPNGCGKTTLLRAAAGLIKAERGQVLLNGVDLLGLPRQERARKVACLPQSRPVPQLRAGLLIEHGRFPHEGFSRRLDPRGREAIEKAIARTDTAALRHRMLTELSGGERQRVYMAAALAQETEILLLDEPTASLDLRYQLETLELCRALAAEGKTVVLVLHDLQQAFTYGDTVCVMAQGRMAAWGETASLLGSPLLREIFGCDVLPGDGGIYSCRLCR